MNLTCALPDGDKNIFYLHRAGHLAHLCFSLKDGLNRVKGIKRPFLRSIEQGLFVLVFYLGVILCGSLRKGMDLCVYVSTINSNICQN